MTQRSPFSSAELTHFRDRLEALKLATLAELREHVRSREELEGSRDVGDQGDEAALGADRELELRLSSDERARLDDIDAALRRIDAGSYGICEVSGEPIPRARLDALPTARTTVDAQAARERGR